MRVKKEREVKSKLQASEEDLARMEAERQAAATKIPLDFSFILCPINFSLYFSFRFFKIDFSLRFNFRLTFQISDCLEIAFRFISDW